MTTISSDLWLVAPAMTGEPGSRPADGPAEGVKPAAREELKALYAAHAPAVHRFLCDLLGDPIAAADATQETFVRAFRRLHTLQLADRPAAWLLGIARYVSLEHRRALRRRRRVLDDAPIEAWDERPGEAAPRSPEEQLIGREALCVLRVALGRLSEDRRTVLLLRLDHGLSYDDIARLMDWSVSKVKVEIHRSRQLLREELDKYERGEQ